MDCVIFYTERAYIRQLKESDFENYFQLEGNPDVMKYITGIARSWPEAEERFVNQLKGYRYDAGFGFWAICLQDRPSLIGTANLNYIPGTYTRHIGYKISPEFQGKGLAAEVARGLLSYGFKCCGLAEISAVCNPENRNSERVMQKAGLEFEGIRHFFGTDCLHYRIDSQKWFLKKL